MQGCKVQWVHDARIAALCLSHGVYELWSGDRDFSRFPALRVRNPLRQPT
jgi:predicted nucleic acid-binding protein